MFSKVVLLGETLENDPIPRYRVLGRSAPEVLFQLTNTTIIPSTCPTTSSGCRFASVINWLLVACALVKTFNKSEVFSDLRIACFGVVCERSDTLEAHTPQ